MSKFTDKLRTKGKVEEDLYFAKRDRELLKAMRQENLAKALDVDGKKKKKACKELQHDFARQSKRYKKRNEKLAKAYKKLVKKARKI